jgi:hypothetical protein
MREILFYFFISVLFSGNIGLSEKERLAVYATIATVLHTGNITFEVRARILKRLWSPGIDSKASIPPAYVAWRAGTINLFLLGA